ncbi:MAG: S8 family peptidase, partial [Bacteroidetes bacterium]|nr:S8 family peptidase [Bacteroidota bacterium]
MKHLLPALLLLLAGNTFAQNNTASTLPKLSPRTKLYLSELEENGKAQIQHNYIYRQTNEGLYMSAVIKAGAGLSEGELNSRGIKVNTKAGNIWTVMIPINDVAAFTKTQGIEYIELDEPVAMALDSVRKSTRVDSVHAGIGLAMPYTGAGVVLGIIDRGFDYTHPTLYDTSGSHLRLKRVWEEKKTGTPPTGFNYGNELTDSAGFMAAQCDGVYNSHGIHVAGISGGSGYGSPTAAPIRYRGMAYESDLVFVSILPDSLQWQGTGISDILDGLNYIYSYAAAQGKPAVANLSWGSPVGPRDGSSLFSQAVNNMTGNGKVMVLSAGNNGELNLHINKQFTSEDTVVKTFPTFNEYLGSKQVWLDAWGAPGMSFCAEMSLKSGNTIVSSGRVCLDDQVHKFKLIGTDGDTAYVNITTAISEYNGKPRMYFGLDSRTNDTLLLTLTSTAGELNIWNGYVYDGSGYFGEFENYGYSWAVDGNTDQTTTDLVATESVISVACYTAKNRYTRVNNLNVSYSSYAPLRRLAPFSSHGPTADGRVKPDIAAPGFCVLSSVSAYDSSYMSNGSDYTSVTSVYNFQGRNYPWAQMSGTSMSSPAAAGIVALLLQVNPQLAPQDVRTILAETAIKDNFTGLAPEVGSTNNLWGHGKINAYRAVIMAADYVVNTGLDKPSGKQLNAALYPNPNSGTFAIDLYSDNAETATILIYDLGGKLVYTDSWNVVPGVNHKQISNTTFGKGTYLTKIATSKGVETLKMFSG